MTTASPHTRRAPRAARTRQHSSQPRPLARLARLVVLPLALLIGAATLIAPPAHAGVLGDRAVEIVNRARAAQGCKALRPVEAVRAAAQQHTDAMAAAGQLSHRLPGEPALRQRLAVNGYPGARVVGEVLALRVQKPSSAVRLWMRSPRHRAILLDCRLRTVGVGVRTTDAGRWWTVDLARR